MFLTVTQIFIGSFWLIKWFNSSDFLSSHFCFFSSKGFLYSFLQLRHLLLLSSLFHFLYSFIASLTSRFFLLNLSFFKICISNFHISPCSPYHTAPHIYCSSVTPLIMASCIPNKFILPGYKYTYCCSYFSTGNLLISVIMSDTNNCIIICIFYYIF